jgi:hypothetical protein
MSHPATTDLPPYPRPSGPGALIFDRLIEFKAQRAEPISREAWNTLCVVSWRLAMAEQVIEMEQQADERARPLTATELTDRAGHLARLCRQLKDLGITDSDLKRIGLIHPATHIFRIHKQLQNP